MDNTRTEPPIDAETLAALTAIARKHLFFDSLETRFVGDLDIHEVSVGCVREALERAYRLGVADGARQRA